MKDRELSELRDPANWNEEQAEVHAPVKGARSVLSVSFSRQDFALVTRCARELGMRTSEFVREAALARATSHHGLAQLSSFTQTGGIEVWVSRPQVTRTAVTVIRGLPEALGITA